jgi:hypothetical protein
VLSLDCLPTFGCSSDCGPLVVLTDASNTTLTLTDLGAAKTVELTQLDRKLLVTAFRAFRDPSWKSGIEPDSASTSELFWYVILWPGLIL